MPAPGAGSSPDDWWIGAMPIDIEDIEHEEIYWSCTSQLRWFRPPGGNDNDLQLQQLWERVSGERAWRIVPTCLAD